MENRHIIRPTHDLTIPNAVLCARNLDTTEKLILSEVIWLQNCNDHKNGSDTYCYASNFYFQMVFNLSKKQVIKCIKSLTEKGYIKIVKYQNGDFRHIRYNKDMCLGQK